MDLFTLCSSGNGCSNSAASKWVPTPFCAAVAVAKQQQQNSSSKIFSNDIACYFAAAAATQYEHFDPIAAKKTLKTVAAAAPCEQSLNL